MSDLPKPFAELIGDTVSEIGAESNKRVIDCQTTVRLLVMWPTEISRLPVSIPVSMH